MLNLVMLCIRGDFDIQWSHHRDPNLSVYSLLQQMANSMLKKSITLHDMEKYFKASTVYQRILWSKCICILPPVLQYFL